MFRKMSDGCRWTSACAAPPPCPTTYGARPAPAPSPPQYPALNAFRIIAGEKLAYPSKNVRFAQIFELQDRILGARIGTVDKFQGQEAPIVIYSMTTSSYADAPRGIEFLYRLNRLNVATSRAKCVCILVASPSVFEAQCRTPRQMQLANAFCRYLELATSI